MTYSRANQGRNALRYKRVKTQPENPHAALIPDQEIAIVPSFKLESGVTLLNVPVAYSTRGRLNQNKDNVIVITHALTGSADVSDWWGPLIGGPGKAFDLDRFLLICLNSLGSPYGSASPMTAKNGNRTEGRYGPEFPVTTIRDDVNIHKSILDDLGIKGVAAVVGGSMGGMLVLEWAYFGKDYVRCIVPIATSSRHSAWGISWGEAQRQCIYCDPKYRDGYYPSNDGPAAGLGAARMSALLTYRSRNSFESRFGRKTLDPARQHQSNINKGERPVTPLTPPNEHWSAHNDGHKNARIPPIRRVSNLDVNRATEVERESPHGVDSPPPSDDESADLPAAIFTDPQFHGATALARAPSLTSSTAPAPNCFSAQSYLRYHGDKFVRRFDSNCYIAITRKLDTHDVSRYRVPPDSPDPIGQALAQIRQPALVLGIESDGLFTFGEQQEIARGIPDARLRVIESPEGHDAFLLQFDQVNRYLLDFFEEVLPDMAEDE